MRNFHLFWTNIHTLWLGFNINGQIGLKLFSFPTYLPLLNSSSFGFSPLILRWWRHLWTAPYPPSSAVIFWQRGRGVILPFPSDGWHNMWTAPSHGEAARLWCLEPELFRFYKQTLKGILWTPLMKIAGDAASWSTLFRLILLIIFCWSILIWCQITSAHTIWVHLRVSFRLVRFPRPL